MKLNNATDRYDNANEIVEGLLRYFNHLWGFIEGGNNAIGSDKKPKWRTERKFRLDAATFYRRFTSTNELIGIRFNTGKEQLTNYLMVDIDRHSRNHPFLNPDNFKRLLHAFEDVGLPSQILVKSSESWGLHLYVPLSKGMHVFTAACWLEKIVKSAGFKIEAGQLECFPNTKSRNPNGNITLYNGHRLPLQPVSGSLLLDDDLNPISDNFLDFIAQMDFVASHKNIVDEEMEAEAELARDAITKERVFKGKNGKSIIDEWVADLLAYQQVGFTSIGQTNNLLCKFACYGRVFLGLENEDLVQYIIDTAVNASGYDKHCRHKHEIEKRARDRAKGAMKYYWKLGDVAKRESTYKSISGQELENVKNHNEEKAYNSVERLEAALERAQALVKTFKNNKTEFWIFVSTISTEMFGVGIGKGTFFKKTNRPIWEKVLTALVLAGQVATATPAEAVSSELENPIVEVEATAIAPVVNSDIEESKQSISSTSTPVLQTEHTGSEIDPQIAENPIEYSQSRPYKNNNTIEPLKTAVDKDSLDLPIYEGLCKREAQHSENQKESFPQSGTSSAASIQEPASILPQSEHRAKPVLKSQRSPSQNSTPRPLTKSEAAEKLDLDRQKREKKYLDQMQQLHASQKALEAQMKTPEYKTTFKQGFAAIKGILNAAKEKLGRGNPSPPT